MKSPRGGVGRSSRHAHAAYLGNEFGAAYSLCSDTVAANRGTTLASQDDTSTRKDVSFGFLESLEASVGARPIMLEAVKLIKLLVEDMQHRRALALQEHWENQIDSKSKTSGSRFKSHNTSAEDDDDDEAFFARDGCVPPLIELVCVRLAPVPLSRPSLANLTSVMF